MTVPIQRSPFSISTDDALFIASTPFLGVVEKISLVVLYWKFDEMSIKIGKKFPLMQVEEIYCVFALL